MKSEIIENAIESVVNKSEYSEDFKRAFIKYVKNKFEDNATESDLKTVLSFIDVKEDAQK